MGRMPKQQNLPLCGVFNYQSKNLIMNILEKKIFGNKPDKYTLENRFALYLSIAFIILILIFALKDFIYLYLKNYLLISSILLSIYIIAGIKTKNWLGGIQGLLISALIITFISSMSLKDSDYFLRSRQYGDFHSTSIGDDLWINLKIKKEGFYEIQFASPKDGSWGSLKKGKISSLRKQRYTDNGQEYYCFYLENCPFNGERTMVAFEHAFDGVQLKFNNSLYLLSDGIGNPWKNN
jgi:hypothetical protein